MRVSAIQWRKLFTVYNSMEANGIMKNSNTTARQCATKNHCSLNGCMIVNEVGYVKTACCCDQDFCNSGTNFGMNLILAFFCSLMFYLLKF